MSGLRILADATNKPKNGVNRQGKAYWRPHREGQALLAAIDRYILSYPGGSSSRYRGDKLLEFEREREAWLKSSERRSIKDHAMARIIAELKSKNFPDHFLEPRYLHDKIQICLNTRMVDVQRKTASSDARRFPSSRDPDDISRSNQPKKLTAHLLQLKRIRANEVIGAEPKRRRTAKNWDGDNDKAREHTTAVSWLQSFKSKLSGLRDELQMRVRLIDPTKIKRNTELCWCYLTWSGHFITCDNPIWKLNFGILLAAMRDALKLPCLPEHKRPLVWFKLAVRMLTLENRFQCANGADEAAMMGVMGSAESPNRVRRAFTA